MTDPERKHPIWSTVGITDHLRGSGIGLFRCSKCDRVPILRDASWGVPPPSHQVECTGCGMRGPRESTPEEAAAVWNTIAAVDELRVLQKPPAEPTAAKDAAVSLQHHEYVTNVLDGRLRKIEERLTKLEQQAEEDMRLRQQPRALLGTPSGYVGPG